MPSTLVYATDSDENKCGACISKCERSSGTTRDHGLRYAYLEGLSCLHCRRWLQRHYVHSDYNTLSRSPTPAKHARTPIAPEARFNTLYILTLPVAKFYIDKPNARTRERTSEVHGSRNAPWPHTCCPTVLCCGSCRWSRMAPTILRAGVSSTEAKCTRSDRQSHSSDESRNCALPACTTKPRCESSVFLLSRLMTSPYVTLAAGS